VSQYLDQLRIIVRDMNEDFDDLVYDMYDDTNEFWDREVEEEEEHHEEKKE
jgi:hypothetical protein